METVMSSKMLTGSFVALITPFNKDGSVDFGAFRTLLKFQEDRGTSAVLIMGSTGETSMLAPEEKKQIIVETAKMKTPRMPIFLASKWTWQKTPKKCMNAGTMAATMIV